jgi:outer membrane receptor for ferrienterochelin and colicin
MGCLSREASTMASSWRASGELHRYLADLHARQIVAADWGFMETMNLLSEGELPMIYADTSFLFSLYALDDWQPNQHWAFNLGIRFEKSVNENDVGEKIIDDNGFAPRLGATFDIRGDGKDLVKATAARYLAGINLTTLSPFIRAAGGQSSYDLYTNTSPDPGTPTWLLTGSVRPDTASATFADGIKPQAIDELTLGYEHAFSPTFGMTLRGVYRDWKDIITETFAYTYPPPDGIATKTLRIDNNGDAKRTYKGVILTAEKSFGAKWQIDGNYTYSKAEGNVISEDGFDTFESFAGVPQTTANRDGFLPWDARHLLKIYGFYHIPINSPRHALTVAANYSYASGNAYAKNNTASFDSGLVVGPGPDGVQDVPLGSSGVAAAGTDDQTDTSVVQFLEPRGSRTEPSQWTLGLALNYNFSFSKRVTWETQFEVFNVTNNQSPLSVQSNYFANPTTASQIRSNYVFGTPSSYSLTGTPQFQTPRTYQFQFGVLW